VIEGFLHAANLVPDVSGDTPVLPKPEIWMTDQKQDNREAPPQLIDSDDQAWLGTCALLLLTGLSAGLVALASDFNDTRLLHNGWTHLVGLVLTVGVLLWVMSKLRGRIKQRMQAAVLVSLFMHLTFGFYIHSTSLPMIAGHDRNSPDEELAETTPVKLPDYTPSASDDSATPELFEQPVETMTPEARGDELDRRLVEAPASISSRSMPAPDSTPTVEPARIELNRDESAVPRRGMEMAGVDIRRQALSEPNLQQELIPLPEAPSAGLAPDAAEPNLGSRRQEASVSLDPQSPPRSPADESAAPDRLAMSRRQAEAQPVLQPDKTPSPVRQPARFAEPQLAPLDVPEVAQAAQQGRGEAQPAPTALAKSGVMTPAAPRLDPLGSDLPAGLELPQLSTSPTRRPTSLQMPAVPRSNAGLSTAPAAGRIGRSNLSQPGMPSGLADEVGPVPIASSSEPVGPNPGTRGELAGGTDSGGRRTAGPTGQLPGGGRAVTGGSMSGQVAAVPGLGAPAVDSTAEPGVVSRRARP